MKTRQEKQTRLEKINAAMIAASDARIFNALQVLQSHNRGLNALAHFRYMADFAQGFDSASFKSLVIITKELANGRRDFLDKIGRVVLPPKPHCLYCGQSDCANPQDCPLRREHIEQDQKINHE